MITTVILLFMFIVGVKRNQWGDVIED